MHRDGSQRSSAARRDSNCETSCNRQCVSHVCRPMSRRPTSSQPSGLDDEWPDDLVELYRERHEPLVRVAAMMLGSRAEAEEVVHEAFAAVQRRWGAVAHPAAYLRRSVVNGATSVLRKRQTAAKYRVDPPAPEAPSQLVEFRDVLLRLPYRQRAVLVLRYVDDRDDEEIGEILGCRRATVRSLASRGLATIRKELT